MRVRSPSAISVPLLNSCSHSNDDLVNTIIKSITGEPSDYANKNASVNRVMKVEAG